MKAEAQWTRDIFGWILIDCVQLHLSASVESLLVQKRAFAENHALPALTSSPLAADFFPVFSSPSERKRERERDTAAE